jgi:hypothetical protein
MAAPGMDCRWYLRSVCLCQHPEPDLRGGERREDDSHQDAAAPLGQDLQAAGPGVCGRHGGGGHSHPELSGEICGGDLMAG